MNHCCNHDSKPISTSLLITRLLKPWRFGGFHVSSSLQCIHRNCSFAVPATTPSSWCSTRQTLHHTQHYLVFCCERKFQWGSVLHQLFSTIQVLCFWSTWFCKIELWHWLLKVSPAKAGNNICIQKECQQLKQATSASSDLSQINNSSMNCGQRKPSASVTEKLASTRKLMHLTLSILRKQITGKQCILWGWRSDYQPINNMRAHGVLESPSLKLAFLLA